MAPTGSSNPPQTISEALAVLRSACAREGTGKIARRFLRAIWRRITAEQRVRRLLRGLSSDDANERALTAWALSEEGPAAAVAVGRLRELAQDPSSNTRGLAIAALPKIAPASEEVAGFLRGLLGSPDPTTRMAAASALGDLDPRVTQSATDLLAAMEPMSRALEAASTDPETMFEALRAQRVLRQSFGALAAADPERARALVDELSSPDASKRSIAIDALLAAFRGAKRATRDQGQTTAGDRASAAAGQLGVDRAALAAKVRVLLDDPDEHTAHTALVLLGELGPGVEDVVQGLVHAIRDPRLAGHVHTAASSVGPGLASASLHHLDDDDPKVRATATDVVGWSYFRRVAPDEIVERVIARLADTDAMVRMRAVYAIGHLGRASEPAVEGLVAALRDPVAVVRGAAGHSLACLKADGAIPALIRALADADESVRHATAIALAQFGEVAISAVRPLLDGTDARLRSGAIYTIGAAQRVRGAAASASAGEIETALGRLRHDEAEVWKLLGDIEVGTVTLTSLGEPQNGNGPVWYEASNGWELRIFNDANEWDYLEDVRSPDGRVTLHADISVHMPRVASYRPSAEVAWARYGIPGHMKRREEVWPGARSVDPSR